MTYVAHQTLVMPYAKKNTDSMNGLVLSVKKHLPGPLLTNRQWGPLIATDFNDIFVTRICVLAVLFDLTAIQGKASRNDRCVWREFHTGLSQWTPVIQKSVARHIICHGFTRIDII